MNLLPCAITFSSSIYTNVPALYPLSSGLVLYVVLHPMCCRDILRQR